MNRIIVTLLLLFGLVASGCTVNKVKKVDRPNTPAATSQPTSLPSVEPWLTPVIGKEPVTIQRSASIEMMTLDELISKSELIVIGEVTAALPSMWDRQNEKDAQQATLEELMEAKWMFTDSIVTVHQIIKGPLEAPTVRVRTFTGETEVIHFESPSEPDYQLGHDYLLFLNKDTGPSQIVEPGNYIATGAIQGVYEIIEDKATSIAKWTGDWYLDELVAYIRQTIRSHFSFGPHGDDPLGDGDSVSLEEAQARLPFQILLPEGFEIERVWITKDAVAPDEQYIAVQFMADLLLTIRRYNKPPDWDKIIMTTPQLTKIKVNGNEGMGTSPGFTTYDGNNYPYPGSVEWWVDGLDITLYSDTFSLDELLKIAETVH